MITTKTKLIGLFGILPVIISCSHEEAGDITKDEQKLGFQELFDQGVDRYLGSVVPISSISRMGGITEHVFNSEDGPICFTGKEFSMITRDGSSNSLLIFLQGGGLCSSNGCSDPVVDEGIPLIPFGILSPMDFTNPTYNFDLGYLPYCDASLWMGDSEVDSDGDGKIDRLYKGLLNLSASLDVVVKTYPTPDKIVLAGNSAGGFGVHAALPLVRKLYPTVKILLINDSGMGISFPGFWETNYEYWNSTSSYLPESCRDCLGDDGNLTNYFLYQMSQDENIEMAFISSKRDATAVVTVGAETFEKELLEMATKLSIAYPNRINSFIPNGDEHTFIVSNFNYPLRDKSVKQWVSAMINGSDTWQSLIE